MTQEMMEGVMDLTDALKEAAKIVEEADLPTDLRAAAFQKAVDSLMGPSAAAASPPVSDTRASSNGRGARSGVQAIAQKLGLPVEVVSEVFEIKDGALDVILGYSRIAAGAAAGTRQLAVLVAAGRQAAGIDADGWTPVGGIRSICKEFNKFDQANFASTVLEMDQWFSISGTGQSRKVKMTRAGWEQATLLVAELTS